MEHLIELAHQLGSQIAAHPRTVLLKKAQKAVNEDPPATQLIKDYHTQAEKITQLERQRKPIEPQDKHQLRDIEQQISTNEKLRELTRCQVDFVEMMRKVKDAIDEKLEMEA